MAELMRRIESAAPALVPDAEVSCQRFVLGPGDSHKIQMRILGPDPQKLRSFGDAALAILRADGRLKDVQSDWRNRAELVEPVVSEERAAKLGLSRSDVARAFRLATDGVSVGGPLPTATTDEPPTAPKRREAKPSAPDYPIAGILTAPYPCVVLRNGTRLTEGASLGTAVLVTIAADKLTLKDGGSVIEWRP